MANDAENAKALSSFKASKSFLNSGFKLGQARTTLFSLLSIRNRCLSEWTSERKIKTMTMIILIQTRSVQQGFL